MLSRSTNPPERSPDAKRGRKVLRLLWDEAGMLLIAGLLFVVCAFQIPYFLTRVNLVGLALAVSMTGMVSCTMLSAWPRGTLISR